MLGTGSWYSGGQSRGDSSGFYESRDNEADSFSITRCHARKEQLHLSLLSKINSLVIWFASVTWAEQDPSVGGFNRISYDILQVTEGEFHILFVVEGFHGVEHKYGEEYQITINLKTGERIVDD